MHSLAVASNGILRMALPIALASLLCCQTSAVRIVAPLRLALEGVDLYSVPSDPNKENQMMHATWMNRYPDIFKKLQEILGRNYNQTLLSFGCASGAEVRTLRKYFPHSKVHGLDVNQKQIQIARTKTHDKNTQFFSNSNSLKHESYGAVLALTCLCHWDNPKKILPPLPYSLFESTLSLIDKFVKPGGYFVVFNANYCFAETELGKKSYDTMTNYSTFSGYAPKYTPVTMIQEANESCPYVFYKKKQNPDLKP
eukprot:gnl/TRDRNA2_/TRDRNA2_85563_c0_seq4.p1 gnl/TRDRNA2_/TRDRNA2_85563_c0~~gnl/TRDRNA2_/TRDRNA2_85563_c0_seq4.p1  ORF type:complete len:254 (+),score=27.27 gnl/TRDRNA2_/TRDRNA2_85563_c0_seq4:77-838(+)